MSGTAAILADDYVDLDVAYLLGMLFGRGQRIADGENRRLLITLDIRVRTPRLPPGVPAPGLDLALENERALNNTRRRINDLLDANVDIVPEAKGRTVLKAVFVKPTIAWRDIELLCSKGTDRTNFRLHDAFVEGELTLLEEFLRGFADVAVTPSFSDNAWGKKARIAFPVVHANRGFAGQLERIFERVGIPAKLLEGSVAKRGSPKEHRIRPFAEDYERIGFLFPHKQVLLQLLAQHNGP